MKKFLFGAFLLMVILMLPVISMAQVSVRVNIPLPPPIPFIAPPSLVVLPGTDVYAVPDIEEDIFFRNGWWWRRWDNRWYRSRYYDHGWAYHRGYPTWYSGIPQDWRDNYRNHIWYGRPWDYHPIPHGDLDRHWRGGLWRTDHGWGPPPPGGPGPSKFAGPGGPPPPPGPGPLGKGKRGRFVGPGGPGK